MVNNEPLVTAADLDAIKLDIASRRWHADLILLFEKEPKLAETMATNWEQIDQMLLAFGLDAVQRALLIRQITLLMGKPMVLLDRAHRRQWDDVLPNDVQIGGQHG